MGLRSADNSASAARSSASSYMRAAANSAMMSRSATASLERPHDLDLNGGSMNGSGLRKLTPDMVNSSQLVRDALRESMISFQVGNKRSV